VGRDEGRGGGRCRREVKETFFFADLSRTCDILFSSPAPSPRIRRLLSVVGGFLVQFCGYKRRGRKGEKKRNHTSAIDSTCSLVAAQLAPVERVPGLPLRPGPPQVQLPEVLTPQLQERPGGAEDAEGAATLSHAEPSAGSASGSLPPYLFPPPPKASFLALHCPEEYSRTAGFFAFAGASANPVMLTWLSFDEGAWLTKARPALRWPALRDSHHHAPFFAHKEETPDRVGDLGFRIGA
jgi:hypothetical protein